MFGAAIENVWDCYGECLGLLQRMFGTAVMFGTAIENVLDCYRRMFGTAIEEF